MMLNKEQHKKVVSWTRAEEAQIFNRQSHRNALLITISGDREKAAIRRLEERGMGGQAIRLQAILAQMSRDDVLEWVREEVLKEYKNLAHYRDLQEGNRSVHKVGAASDGKAVMDAAGAEGGEGVDDDDDEDEPAEPAVCAFVADNLHKRSKQGRLKPLQQG